MFEALNVATNPLERMRARKFIEQYTIRFHGQNCKTLFIYFTLKIFQSKDKMRAILYQERSKWVY